jgi:hypothetical protein
MYQIATKLPNDRKIYQMAVTQVFQMAIEYTNLFHSKSSQKYTQIGIFDLKKYHLATLVQVMHYSFTG